MDCQDNPAAVSQALLTFLSLLSLLQLQLTLNVSDMKGTILV